MLVYLQMIETADDKEKFEQIYLTYRKLMLYVANKILKNEQDAEDAVHEAFLAIIKSLEKISQVKCLKTQAYVVIIVERKAIDIIRKRKDVPVADFDDEILGIEISVEDKTNLHVALASLPSRQREALILYYFGGYTVKEIANILEMKPPAVYKMMERAKETLKKTMEQGGTVL